MTTLSPVGIVGVGLMGQVFARRLMDAGFSVVGYDVDPAKNAALIAMGGATAASPGEVAKRCPATIVVVFSIDQVEDVVEKEILPAVGDGSGKIVLCASTCDPDRVATLGERVTPRGIRFLETPVSGTSEEVRQGKGVGLIGGDPALAAEIKPLIDALYPRAYHIGKYGDGSRTKLAINLILGINRTALAEGLVFAESVGLDLTNFLGVLKESAAYSRVMEGKGPKMVRGDFTPQGMVQVSYKDSTLMREQGEKRGQQLPLLEAYRGVLEGCMKAGEGQLDNSAVIGEIRRRRG